MRADRQHRNHRAARCQRGAPGHAAGSSCVPQRAIDNLPAVPVDARKLEDRADAAIARDWGKGPWCSAGPVAGGGSQRAQCGLGQ